MEHRSLGRTGIRVSALCLGTMTFGQQNTEAEGHAQMDYALSQGINFLDTAEIYSIPPKAETQGSTERIIGSWLKARKNRDKVVIASKIAGRGTSGYLRRAGGTTCLNRAQIFEAIDGSLSRLGTDYIDLYQLHSPDRPMVSFGSNPTVYTGPVPGETIPPEETLAALAELVKLGKIRSIGLSNETAWGTMSFLHHATASGLPRMATIQNAYNLVNRTFEIGLAEIAMREDVGLLPDSPLAQGFLTGKYLDGARPPNTRTTLFDRAQRYEKPGVDTAIHAYVALARELGIDLAQMALQFVTTRPFVASNIIGATTLEQLKTDISSVNLKWTDEIEARINTIHQLHQNPAP